MKQPRITSAIILQHMQGMEQRLTNRMDILDGKIERVEQTLSKRIDRVEARLSAQIDMLDRRLDDIEIVMPQLKKLIATH